MKALGRIIERKMNMAELGQALLSVAMVCRSLQEDLNDPADPIKILQEEGLSQFLQRAKAAVKNPRSTVRLPKDIEGTVLEYTLRFPHHGQDKVSRELKRKGIFISAGSVRGIWLKHRLERKEQRIQLSGLSGMAQPDPCHEQDATPVPQALPEEAVRPAQHFLQDTYFVGYVRGVGKVYHQIGIDMYTGFAFVKIYDIRKALTAADFLNDLVLPFFEGYALKMDHIWTDEGVEFCGARDSHPYQIFLQVNGIEQRKIMPDGKKAIHDLNSILQQNFYNYAFKKNRYSSLQDIQTDLDAFMDLYNSTLQKTGLSEQGLTPWEKFLSSRQVQVSSGISS